MLLILVHAEYRCEQSEIICRFLFNSVVSQVVCVPDVTSIYRVPLLLEDQKVVEFFATRLGLPLPTPRPRKFLNKWRDLADR